MRLAESDPALSSVNRAVEERTRGIDTLAALELPVVLLPDFDCLPEVESSNKYRETPAAYRPSEGRILINGSKFLSLEPDIAQAVLAHEVAHAVCHRDSIVMRDDLTYGIPVIVSEDIVADLLACRWGFSEGLRKERIKQAFYGSEYCEILALWQDETQFVHQMFVWHQQRMAGIRRSASSTD